MKKATLIQTLLLLLIVSVFFQSCDDNGDETVPVVPELVVPTTYSSADFDANVTFEDSIRNELGSLTSDLNSAESDAGMSSVSAITYPSKLKTVTNTTYATKIDAWLVELVKAANSGVAFDPTTAPTGDGGLYGTRLLDENGLELEQMIEKGSFGAALYNHALTIINGELTSASTDKLIEIFGTDVTFDVTTTTQAATYARRRSDLDAKTGLFFDMRDNLLTAKAAIEGGDLFVVLRDQALADFKLNWEKSNFATVIFYCNATKEQLRAANTDEDRGNAMHAYAEGVAFAAGWKGLSDKTITDDQIDEILTKLLAQDGQTPTSYQFINDANLLTNLDETIELIQEIYGFTDTEVASFYVNNNP